MVQGRVVDTSFSPPPCFSRPNGEVSLPHTYHQQGRVRWHYTCLPHLSWYHLGNMEVSFYSSPVATSDMSQCSASSLLGVSRALPGAELIFPLEGNNLVQVCAPFSPRRGKQSLGEAIILPYPSAKRQCKHITYAEMLSVGHSRKQNIHSSSSCVTL